MLATSEKAKLEKSFPVMLGSLADRAVQKKPIVFLFVFCFLISDLMGCILKRLILLHSTVHINRTRMTLLQACTIVSVITGLNIVSQCMLKRRRHCFL